MAVAPTESRKQLDHNQLNLGLFGANCSGGLAVTTVPERWEASWEKGSKNGRRMRFGVHAATGTLEGLR